MALALHQQVLAPSLLRNALLLSLICAQQVNVPSKPLTALMLLLLGAP